MTRTPSLRHVPWERGLDAAGMEEYFREETVYYRWRHSITDAPLVKLRHPDYELFTGSNHHAAGVACSDCHMPFAIEGNRKITSHRWASPLENLDASCGVCHRRDDGYLRERILLVQDEVETLLRRVAEELAEGIVLLGEAIADPAADRSLIALGRELHAGAFIRYDWVEAANSTGFHNPREALATLAEAMRLAKELQITALRAKANR